MNTIGNILIWLCVMATLFLALFAIKANTQYTREVESYWHLADKSSTIVEKSEYIDKFVAALDSQGLEGTYHALLFKTPNDLFDNNLKALKSLQLRLKEISGMDVASFEYQTAIQQITAQEQGEADPMLSQLKGAWFKVNYPLIWFPHLGLIAIGLFIVFLVALFIKDAS